MIQIVVILILTLFVGLALQKIVQSLSGNAGNIRRGLIGFGVLLGLALAATGRLGVLIPLVGALIAGILRVLPVLVPMLMQYLPLWQRWQQQQQAARQTAGGAPGGSTAESHYLRMHLDHQSGRISGDILAGRFAGRRLADLSREQLADFYRECRGDPESASLFEAYFERVYGETWSAGSEQRQDRGRGRRDDSRQSPSGGNMTRAEAYEVLGLKTGASRDEVVSAHRRLMQKMHPDRGGSDYLAAKINQAKAILLA